MAKERLSNGKMLIIDDKLTLSLGEINTLKDLIKKIQRYYNYEYDWVFDTQGLAIKE